MSEFGRNQPFPKTRISGRFHGSREDSNNQQKSLLYDLGAGGRWFKSNRPDQFLLDRLRGLFSGAKF